MKIDRNLSFSQIKQWHECRRAHAYKYRDGYLPRRAKVEFMRGSLLHLGMEHKVTADYAVGPAQDADWWKQALKEWNAEWNAAEDDELIYTPEWFDGCRAIVEAAVEVFHQDWEVLTDDRGPLLERRMYAELPDWYKAVVFIPDALCRKRRDPYRGGIFVVDYKSFAKPKEEAYGEVDLQGAIYQRGVREKGIPAIGTCLFELATEPRKPVRIKKDGEAYAGDQGRFDNWSAVSGQLITLRSDEHLDNVWEQIVCGSAREMHAADHRASDLTDRVPHMSYYVCRFCDYREPCMARLKGLDEADILANQYTQRPKK